MKAVTALSTIIRARAAGGPAIILDDRLLNPAFADEMLAGAHFVQRLAKTGDALDHELFFVNWAMTAAPIKETDKLRRFYNAQRLSSRTEHPLDSTTYAQRDQVGETATLTIVFEGKELNPTDPEDARKAAILVRELARVLAPHSLSVLGDANAFFTDWVFGGHTLDPDDINQSRELAAHIEEVWALSEGKKRGRIAEPDDEPSTKGRSGRSSSGEAYSKFGTFKACDEDTRSILSVTRSKGAYDTIVVQSACGVLNPCIYEQWLQGCRIIKLLADKNPQFDSGQLIFQKWSADPLDEEEQSELAERCAAIWHAHQPVPVSAAASPQVGQTWWCLMPTKSRITLQQMQITYISDKRVELLIAGRQNNSTNLANYRRDDIEFVEVVQ